MYGAACYGAAEFGGIVAVTPSIKSARVTITSFAPRGWRVGDLWTLTAAVTDMDSGALVDPGGITFYMPVVASTNATRWPCTARAVGH